MSARAVAILRQLEKLKTGDFVFAGQARNKPLSNMAMEMVLRRMKIDDGFRSSFRDWAGNVSNFPREITETALAHVIGDKAEQAYPLEQRAQNVLRSFRLNAFGSTRNHGTMPTLFVIF